MIAIRQDLKAAALAASFLLSGMAQGWTAAADSYGFTVDTSVRNDVVSFWQSVYLKSEGYQNRIAWTGNYTSVAAGAEGTISAAFVADVERRTNFVRALCGVPANVRFNTSATVNIFPGDTFSPPVSTTKSAAAQRSALMIQRTAVAGSGNGLSHDPPTTCIAWTTAAWNANSKSNLAYALYGPGAIDSYFREDVAGVSAWNVDVGHRRWLLNLQSTDFATGDTPGKTAESNGGIALPPSNTVYVVPKLAELDDTVLPKFVAYPGAGFFPAPLNTPFWSLSYPGANFNAATVTMATADDTPVTVTGITRNQGYGDNAIVWNVPAAVAAKSFSADTTYKVTVSGIAGVGIPTSHSYTVTLINPNRTTDDLTVSGAANPPLTGASYSFTRSVGSDAMEVGFFQPVDSDWVEGAEDSPTPQIIDRTDSTYPLRANVTLTNTGSPSNYFRSGSKAFRLTFPTNYEPHIGGVADQVFELSRELLPGAGASLNFWYRRGYMTTGTLVFLETSSDGGVTWIRPASPTVAGGSSGTPDGAFTSMSVSLASSSTPLRVRFRMLYNGGSLYTLGAQPTAATGIFIDDISATNCKTLEKRAGVESTSAAVTSVDFNSTTAQTTLDNGQVWWLRLRSRLGGNWFPYGPAKVVEPSGPLTVPLLPSGPSSPPDTGATYSFLPDLTATSYQLDVAKLASVSWLEGAEASPAPKVVDQTGAYALISTKFRKTGRNSFRLALDGDGDSSDAFEIDRDLVPRSGSNLTFQVKRGKMLNTNFIHAEVSTNGGSTWTSLWNQAGLGVTTTSTTVDRAFVPQTVSLSSYAGKEIRLRFVFRKDPAAITIAAASKTDVGAWFDDIAVSNASLVESRVRTTLDGAASSFVLDSATASPGLIAGSTYRLRLRALVGDVPGAWGTALSVVPIFSVPIVNWTEGAEVSPAPQVSDSTGSYDLLSTRVFKTGRRSFRLALDNASDASDSFEINRTLIPSPGSRLTFQTRRGRMLNSNSVHAEISEDGGTTWNSVWSQNGLATSLTASTADRAFVAQSVSLASYAAKNIRVRFVFRNSSPGNTITSVSRVDAGMWLDDISVSFSGVGASPAPLALAMILPITSEYATWQGGYPEMIGQAFEADKDGDGTPNGVEYAFSLDPTISQPSSDTATLDPLAAVLRITRPLPVVRSGISYGAEWTEDFSTWSSEGVTVTTEGGWAIATAPLGSGKRFIRWKITQP